MDQPKIERMLRLMKMMTTNNSYSVDSMAKHLGMSRRTVYRYIDTFREAGFVIKKSGNFIRLDKESPHFKDISQLVHFTEEEATILKRAIENIDDNNMLKQNLKRKLYSVYDNKILADTIVKGETSAIVHSLIEAIEDKKVVLLRDYSSAHGSAVRNRRVEPFAFTTNYVQVWCYDTESHTCKLFKTSRIGSVEILNEDWQFEEKHDKGFIDIFRMTKGDTRLPVKLRLGMMAHSLLIEEYPRAEQDLTQDGEYWILDTVVADYAGVARFVVGLMDDIRIIDSPDLESYIADYVQRFWPQISTAK